MSILTYIPYASPQSFIALSLCFLPHIQDTFGLVKTGRTTANLVTCVSLNYETTSFYQLTVQACDSAVDPLCDTAPVVVTVEDRNDNAPLFSEVKYLAQINETDTSQMMVSVVTVIVSDSDSPPNSISNFIILTPLTPFGLRSATPTTVEVYVANPGDIDFESGTVMYEIDVLAINSPAVADDVTQNNTVRVCITVVDRNDNAPRISEPFQFSVRENQPSETLVGCVVAMDSDSGVRGTLEYSIPSFPVCSNDVPFSINQTSGCLSTCTTLDYEEQTIYTFVVMVCDQSVAEVMMCSSRNFTVNVDDLNDNPLEYSQDPYIVDLNENSQPGSILVTIESVDRDSLPNSQVSNLTLGHNPS